MQTMAIKDVVEMTVLTVFLLALSISHADPLYIEKHVQKIELLAASIQ